MLKDLTDIIDDDKWSGDAFIQKLKRGKGKGRNHLSDSHTLI